MQVWISFIERGEVGEGGKLGLFLVPLDSVYVHLKLHLLDQGKVLKNESHFCSHLIPRTRS